MEKNEKEIQFIDEILDDLNTTFEKWKTMNHATPKTDKYIQSRFENLLSSVMFYRKEFEI